MPSVLLKDMGFIESPATIVHIGVDTTTIVVTGKCKWSEVFDHVPAYNSKYEDVGSHLGDLRYLDTRVIKDENGLLCTLTINVGPYDSDRIHAGHTIWSLSVGTLEKPLETHPDYVVGWNYDTLTHATKNTEYKKHRSYNTQAEEDAGYTIALEATKPGVENYILPSPVVEKRKFYTHRSAASRAAEDVGTRDRPTTRFGIKSGDWLVMSAEVRKNGDLWEAVVRYQFADDWDSDLYTK